MNENTLCKPDSWFLFQIEKIMKEEMTPQSEPKECWKEREWNKPTPYKYRKVNDRPPLTRIRSDYDVENFHNA